MRTIGISPRRISHSTVDKLQFRRSQDGLRVLRFAPTHPPFWEMRQAIFGWHTRRRRLDMGGGIPATLGSGIYRHVASGSAPRGHCRSPAYPAGDGEKSRSHLAERGEDHTPPARAADTGTTGRVPGPRATRTAGATRTPRATRATGGTRTTRITRDDVCGRAGGPGNPECLEGFASKGRVLRAGAGVHPHPPRSPRPPRLHVKRFSSGPSGSQKP
jgi:hypothetical protein